MIIREDKDLRGRRPGEVPELLREEIVRTHPHLPLDVVPDEKEALNTAMRIAAPGDLIVLFCEKPEGAITFLRNLGGKPATTPEEVHA